MLTRETPAIFRELGHAYATPTLARTAWVMLTLSKQPQPVDYDYCSGPSH